MHTEETSRYDSKGVDGQAAIRYGVGEMEGLSPFKLIFEEWSWNIDQPNILAAIWGR